MTLSSYHQKYAEKSDEELGRRAGVKREELVRIFSIVPTPATSPVRVAVLGCGERRFVGHHRRMFAELLRRPVELTTFDISIEHLRGEEGVIEHDITMPLPGAPYDITYGHVVLKFIPTEKQWDAIARSHEALRPGGIAIHVFDMEEIKAATPELPGGLYAVPLDRWKSALSESGIVFSETRWTVPVPGTAITVEGYALILTK